MPLHTLAYLTNWQLCESVLPLNDSESLFPEKTLTGNLAALSKRSTVPTAFQLTGDAQNFPMVYLGAAVCIRLLNGTASRKAFQLGRLQGCSALFHRAQCALSPRRSVTDSSQTNCCRTLESLTSRGMQHRAYRLLPTGVYAAPKARTQIVFGIVSF